MVTPAGFSEVRAQLPPTASPTEPPFCPRSPCPSLPSGRGSPGPASYSSWPGWLRCHGWSGRWLRLGRRGLQKSQVHRQVSDSDEFPGGRGLPGTPRHDGAARGAGALRCQLPVPAAASVPSVPPASPLSFGLSLLPPKPRWLQRSQEERTCEH